MPDRIKVISKRDGISGELWGIEPGKVLVEFDFQYLVAFDLADIMFYDDYMGDLFEGRYSM